MGSSCATPAPETCTREGASRCGDPSTARGRRRRRSRPRGSPYDWAVGAPTYSLVIPIYNEQECLPELLTRLRSLMERLDGPAEVVFVDDGSRDRSYGLIVDACRADDRFRAIQLSRNFGHQLAITAGLDFAAGDAVVVMDADLQDPPEVVLEMAARWREG